VIVVKFGGTSLAGTERMRAAARIVAAHRRDQSVVCVVSAMAEVTDMLIRTMSQVTSGDTTWQATLAEISMRHQRTWVELTSTTGIVPTTTPRFEAAWAALEADLRHLVTTTETTAAAHAHALAAFSGWGERLSVLLFSAALAAEGLTPAPYVGEPVVMLAVAHVADRLVDARACPRGENIPWQCLAPSVEATHDALAPHLAGALQADSIPVLPGYLARTVDGAVTTVGRNGSDYSAALIAAALRAGAVYLYSNVPGVHQADPHVVPEAAVLPRLTYADAAEIAALGARVLHPATLYPLAAAGIPLRLRSSWHPDMSGTEIGPVGLMPVEHEVDARWVVAAHPLKDDRPLAAIPLDWEPGLVEVTGLYLRHADWEVVADGHVSAQTPLASPSQQPSERKDGPISGALALLTAAPPPLGLIVSGRRISVAVPPAESVATQRRLYHALVRADARARCQGETLPGERRRTS
jgi:aspartate kinase